MAGKADNPDEGYTNGTVRDEALLNSAVVGSSNTPVAGGDTASSGDSASPEQAAPTPGSAEWLDVSNVDEVNAWLADNDGQRAAVVRLERKREHPRKGITGDA